MPFASLLLAADSATTVPLTAALDNPVGQMYPMIATVVVFLIVFGILATVVWPKILGGLEDRQQKIQETSSRLSNLVLKPNRPKPILKPN